jgi:hypothetical protein
MRLIERLKSVTPVWAAMGLTVVTLVVLAWMFRYERAAPPYSLWVWDRWTQDFCLVSKQPDGGNMACIRDRPRPPPPNPFAQ